MEAIPHDAALLLPEGTRLLHIGPPKTGTTTVQAAFHAVAAKLASQGVHYAGRSRHPRRAVFAVTGRRWVGGEPPPISEWTDLVHEIRSAASPRIVISSEALAQADDAQIRRIVEDLGGDRVHVVLTLRSLARILPSSWQQSVQTGSDIRYDDWLATTVESDAAAGPRSFWYRHRHDRLVERWAEVVGADHITAIVVDDRDRSHVLRVFEDLTGLRPGTLEERPDLTNRSLTTPEAEAVRAFNAAFWKAGLGVRLHNRVMHLGASERMKLRQPSAEWTRIETPPWALERAGAIARAIVAGVAASGVRVVGDLDSLVVAPGSTMQATVSATDASPDHDWVPSEIAGEMALGILIAGGLATDGAAASGRRAHDLTGVPSRDMARALAQRTRAAAARRVRLMKPGPR